MKIYITEYLSPLGKLNLLSDGKNLTSLLFQNFMFLNNENTYIYKDDLNIFINTKSWLDRYFNQENPNINSLDLLPTGSKFSQMVWYILRQIPYGTTTTYGDIAKIIAKEKGIKIMSSQAIGNAIGKNPILIILPCHRVIGKNGNLTGFSCGIKNKVALLKLENVNIEEKYYI